MCIRDRSRIATTRERGGDRDAPIGTVNERRNGGIRQVHRQIGQGGQEVAPGGIIGSRFQHAAVEVDGGRLIAAAGGLLNLIHHQGATVQVNGAVADRAATG